MFGLGLPELGVLVLVVAVVALLLAQGRRRDASSPQTSELSTLRARRFIKILGWYIIVVTPLRLFDEFPLPLSPGTLSLGQSTWVVFTIYFVLFLLFVCVPGTLAFGLLNKKNWARWGWVVFGLLNVAFILLGQEVARATGKAYMPFFGDLLTLSWIVSLFWLFRRDVAADFKSRGDYASRGSGVKCC